MGLRKEIDVTQADAIRPFRVEVPAADLEDVRYRLSRTRWPDELPGDLRDFFRMFR